MRAIEKNITKRVNVDVVDSAKDLKAGDYILDITDDAYGTVKYADGEVVLIKWAEGDLRHSAIENDEFFGDDDNIIYGITIISAEEFTKNVI